VSTTGWNESTFAPVCGSSWINGVRARYTEAETGIAQDGHIGIQIHGGGIALVQVKEVRIEELAADPRRSDVATGRIPKTAPARTREEGAGRWAEEKRVIFEPLIGADNSASRVDRPRARVLRLIGEARSWQAHSETSLVKISG